MATEQILNMDCSIEENKTKLVRILQKQKPIQKIMKKRGQEPEAGDKIAIEILEEVLHGLCIHYGYRFQWIDEYYEKENGKQVRFVFYHTSVIMPDKQWAGEVYGKSLWELYAKLIVKVIHCIKTEGQTK